LRKTRRTAALIVLGLVAAGYVVPVVFAVAHTVNFTAAQDTAIENKLIPAYNRMHCARYGRPTGCTSANLVASGCVVVNACTALGLPAGTACTTMSTLNVESCVIYTADATGEDAMLQELLNQKLVDTYNAARSQAGSDFKAGFAAASGANQSAACVAAGQATTCDGP